MVIYFSSGNIIVSGLILILHRFFYYMFLWYNELVDYIKLIDSLASCCLLVAILLQDFTIPMTKVITFGKAGLLLYTRSPVSAPFHLTIPCKYRLALHFLGLPLISSLSRKTNAESTSQLRWKLVWLNLAAAKSSWSSGKEPQTKKLTCRHNFQTYII